MVCPICLDYKFNMMRNPTVACHFCSQQCFAKAWKNHRLQHAIWRIQHTEVVFDGDWNTVTVKPEISKDTYEKF
jgi:hypothetical protein